MSTRWHLGLATLTLLLASNCGSDAEPTGCAQVGALFRSSTQFTESATDESKVYVGDLGGRLWRVRLADGEAKMIAETPGESIWTAVFQDDTVYFTASPPGLAGRQAAAASCPWTKMAAG
jgi:Tfp pilus tip-associated adhesin PilY1